MRSRIWAVMALLVCGCGGSDGPSTPACKAIVGCGVSSAEQCDMVFGALVLEQTCIDAIVAAPCEEHAKMEPSYMELCFPTCAGTDATCAGDRIITCRELRTYVVWCDKACETQNLTFTGVCADEYQGQPSSTGDDMCWCK